MIQDCSMMDEPIQRKNGGRRLFIIMASTSLLLGGALTYPSLSRWLRSETSIDSSRIRIGEVVRGDLVREVVVEGRVVATFHPTLYSSAPGIVTLSVKAGAYVTTGQELGSINSPELENRLQQESSRLEALTAELERQRITARQQELSNRQQTSLLEVELESSIRAMDRAQRSKKLGIVNDVEYEQAEDNLRIARLKLDHSRRLTQLASSSLAFEESQRVAQVRRQELAVKDLERQVAALSISSPVTGLVSRLFVEDREAVPAHAALITVVDLSAFELEIAIPESYADQIVLGLPAFISNGNHAYRGEVRSISPEVAGNQVKGIVAFVDETPTGLKQHQRLPARLVIETRRNILKAPRGPFLENGGGRLAYVIENEMARRRTIQTGALSLKEVEIVDGVEVGERLIVSDTTRFNGAASVLLRH